MLGQESCDAVYALDITFLMVLHLIQVSATCRIGCGSLLGNFRIRGQSGRFAQLHAPDGRQVLRSRSTALPNSSSPFCPTDCPTGTWDDMGLDGISREEKFSRSLGLRQRWEVLGLHDTFLKRRGRDSNPRQKLPPVTP